MNANKVLNSARLTEKANQLSAEFGQYTFEVNRAATKHAIREAIEKTFKVSVTRVNVLNVRGKNKKSRQGRPSQTSDFKKAVVTLKSGDKIELV
ncbi:MAG: 50S ribosomal protein L23 [Opitutae bacterium]|nr:50S ribosomal protein L23 [Opitutae bacterium]